MFYVSSKSDNLIGVTDTSDNIEEFYTLEQISTFISRGVKITGVSVISNGITARITCIGNKFYSVIEETLFTNAVNGIPLRLKLQANLDFKQCIFVSKESKGTSAKGFSLFTYTFYDGTLFSLSSKFLKEHKDEIKVDYNDNKPEEVARLIKQLKKKSE